MIFNNKWIIKLSKFIKRINIILYKPHFGIDSKRIIEILKIADFKMKICNIDGLEL